MSALTWDATGERLYETGIDKVVLFRYSDEAGQTYENGIAWNGVTAINESPSGAEATALYADNIKYLNLLSVEELGLTIEAYDSPAEFDECDGLREIATGITIGQQNRKHFGLCYRTLIGNDTEGTDKGYKIHLVYDCVASPSEKSHSTVNDNPDATQLSWDVNTTPIEIPASLGANLKKSATLEIDSTKVSAATLTAIEGALYGTSETESYLPLPAELVALISN